MLNGNVLCRLFATCIGVIGALDAFGAPSRDARLAKPPTDVTIHANQAASSELPLLDRQDFEDATRGRMAPLPHGGVVKGRDGEVVWDMTDYAFLSRNPEENAPAPTSVHPSLWRQSQLLAIGGLFKVADRIYQVRNIDLSNITFIEGDKGLIILDPLISTETAKAALELYFQHRPKRPVVAVIYSHSHVDHFGGVRGVVDEADVKAGKVAIIAPNGFMEEAVSENVFAGNAMGRRATYMYGQLLLPGERGVVSTGLGITASKGTPSLIAPTLTIDRTGKEISIDGLTLIFQMTPNTEAPAEMLFYVRELRALCTAENAVHNLHNIYTLRGAKIRDPRAWAKALDETLALFGDKSDLIFAPHHWPVWGNDKVTDYLKKQRDMYQYINDQTLRLANKGYKMTEIAERFEVPESLRKEWYLRGYYGSINHNVKATYVRYLGWYDSNPATLHGYPEVEASQRYVEFMGGEEAVLGKARAYFSRGDYRWVVQVVNHVVMANPRNEAARTLQADALEQLGYLSENGPWRNEYLTAALELRRGVVREAAGQVFGVDTLNNMPIDMLFDYFGLRLNGPKAANENLSLAFNFTDTHENVLVTLENGVLHHKQDGSGGDASVTMARAKLNDIILKRTSLADAMARGDVTIGGNPGTFQTFLSLLDDFDFWFNIVTPHAEK